MKELKNFWACHLPTPVPSKCLFNAHPAKQADMRYKMKLITNSGVDTPLPIPKAIADHTPLELRQTFLSCNSKLQHHLQQSET